MPELFIVVLVIFCVFLILYLVREDRRLRGGGRRKHTHTDSD